MAHEPTVFIVDDDTGVRTSLAALLRAAEFHVEAYASAPEFLEALVPGRFGCVVADVRMPGMTGLELQEILVHGGIALPVIIITGHADVPMAVAGLRGGAVDFIEKPFREETIIFSVRRALEEGAKFHQRVSLLTTREREVLAHVAVGKPNKVIAHELGISLRTVEVHRANVMEKMEATNLAQLIHMAVAAKIV